MWQNFRKNLDKLTPAQIIVSYYLIAVAVSMGLLSLPIAIQPDAKWSLLDALFTAASAVSVTGLTVVTTSETFTVPGIFILMFVLQFGGIGIMTLGTFFWLILRKKIGLRERQLIMTDQNQTSMAGLVKLLKEILFIIILIEIIGSLVLGVYFLKYFPTWQEAFLQGMFAAVSATTNAGFDITGSSLMPFANDYFIQTINILLLTLGAIGFPVLIELKGYLLRKNKKTPYSFSLYTKLTSITFFGLLFFGTIAIFVLEYNHFFSNKTWHESFFYSLFQSATTRNGGLATMDINDFSEPTLLLLVALMFIGASPSSVGGGIRTTTFALNLLFLYHFARGRRSVKIFNREVHQEDIIKSLVVSILAVFICFFAVVLLMVTENQPILAIVFEVASAFGTTGLSMGITPELTSIGKIVIIALMFIGRVGVISFLFIIGGKAEKESIRYPKERVIIG
ncbi:MULTISPECIES: TrkH family potassium uptake protein [unclassified Bacillus (in: firmicutes)]|uniref:TrkH family potassium uptake protein n=1 Tax=unclassified Bacillus (in: firmicutes) TaxID=185979 RepID=UPI001BE8EB87|nr:MULTISPECIES: TrkH family potassium uptake protein [unclassified Bacillus (in: firmicutes)]MBT2637385.1 TrkH family potassium uptake protein [Bacillus sp. ISL-39]MBT2660458.1 TrkH family potassium uptake protein [Bacillus sp. ISL-45]